MDCLGASEQERKLRLRDEEIRSVHVTPFYNKAVCCLEGKGMESWREIFFGRVSSECLACNLVSSVVVVDLWWSRRNDMALYTTVVFYHLTKKSNSFYAVLTTLYFFVNSLNLLKCVEREKWCDACWLSEQEYSWISHLVTFDKRLLWIQLEKKSLWTWKIIC